MTLAPGPFRNCPGLAGDHRLVNIGSALDDCAIRRNAGSGPDKDNVTHFQLRNWNGLSLGFRLHVRQCPGAARRVH